MYRLHSSSSPIKFSKIVFPVWNFVKRLRLGLHGNGVVYFFFESWQIQNYEKKTCKYYHSSQRNYLKSWYFTELATWTRKTNIHRANFFYPEDPETSDVETENNRPFFRISTTCSCWDFCQIPLQIVIWFTWFTFNKFVFKLEVTCSFWVAHVIKNTLWRYNRKQKSMGRVPYNKLLIYLVCSSCAG